VTSVLVRRTSSSNEVLPSRDTVTQYIEYVAAASRPLIVIDV
jgi:hypothetical protein